MTNSNKSNVFDIIGDPIQRFFKIEASGGIILLFSTVVALVWANSPWGHTYHEFWEGNNLTLGIGNFEISKTFHHWINDGLMAIFFFVVGLEIKREMLTGELSSIKKASLPIAAAIGGMVVPALIYVALNRTPGTSGGWGIPMATDIAFSLGVLTLLGKRVPLALKVFLVAFAIVDDLGAVLIIAFFYTAELHVDYLLYGLGLFLVLLVFNRLRIRAVYPYMAVGWVIWYFFLKSGIHPTIAGVLIAFTIPIYRKIKISTFRNRIDCNLQQFQGDEKDKKETLDHHQLAAIDNIGSEMRKVQSPLQHLEHTLHGFVTYLVMPVFALANAGVAFHGSVTDIFSALSLQIEVSLVLGKVLGILLFSFLSVKLGIAVLPKNTKWTNILGLGLLGGMGFTMSLFIANLAFAGPEHLDPAKVGILIGSLISGVAGYFVLKGTLKAER